MAHQIQREIAGRLLSIQAGELASQAGGAVLLRYGDTVLLVTACMAGPREGGMDFLPLTVDYEERLYAAGKIPGSFFRREGRPTQEATLAARLSDRSIRPLFPKGFRNEVQVVATVLSVDQENPPDILALIGASAALSLSDVPFEGPIAGCRVGYANGELVVNPTFSQLQESGLDLIVAGSRDAVVMVEAQAREVPEGLLLQAVQRGQEVNQEIIALIEALARDAGRPKLAFTPPQALDPSVERAVADVLVGRLRPAMFTVGEKGERDSQLDALQQEVVARLGERHPQEALVAVFQHLTREELRGRILEEGIRPDGRGPRDLRPISCEVSVLPRTHGSGLFRRGQTQVLAIATLGSLGEEQRLDTLSPEDTKRFLHHYNFPPYSTGEVRRIGSPGRREIGHGALAERALEPAIPGVEEFPYTIRLVSEVLSSNGSTSMASVCASALALMDAGVPIKAPVAGIAMGLIKGEGSRFRVLTDIQGLEDHMGDMDFKVAGTREGVTALQMDIKVKGISLAIMEEALAQAREARLVVLQKMHETIPEVRPTLSPYAPRVLRLTIPVDKIGAVIGPGGKTIRSIIEETKATIDVEDDGTVLIGSPNEAALQRAREMVEALTQDVEIGAIYTGKVTRITTFGAFVQILPGKEGLVRLGELSERRLERAEDEVKTGDEITVMVTEIDRMGRINLSRRAVSEGLDSAAARQAREGPGRPRPGMGPRPGFGPGGPRPPMRPGGGPPYLGPRPEGSPPPRGDRSPGPGPQGPRPGFAPRNRPPGDRPWERPTGPGEKDP
ncbi:MAG: polyribonucleotide nucleotidyltransferase [Chloroflexi bacterium]|nr:polyribonucleotide nucleotidyltransferase [Chloroflexota bacterium]